MLVTLPKITCRLPVEICLNRYGAWLITTRVRIMARIKVRKMVRLPERTHEVTGEWPNECAIEKNERTKNDRSNERMGESTVGQIRRSCFYLVMDCVPLMSQSLEVTSIQVITSKRNVGSYMISD